MIERSNMQLTFLDYKATILIKEHRCAFAKKKSSTLSKFSLKTFGTFTNSEKLRFFSMSLYNVCDVMNEGHVR